MSALPAAAERITKLGRPVFPCWPGEKAPCTPNGFKDASRDPARIRNWWARYPDHNIGMPTGEISGFVVLDVDDHDALVELEHRHGKIPETRSVVTPRGGAHLYFRHPGGEVRSRTNAPAAGLDIRGDGGYVLVPPAEVGGRRYEIDDDLPPAQMPGWLLELIRHKPTSNGRVQSSEWARLAQGVREPGRNNAVTRVIGHLLAKGVDPHLARALVIAWNHRFNEPRLPEPEVVRACNSIVGAELRKLEA